MILGFVLFIMKSGKLWGIFVLSVVVIEIWFVVMSQDELLANILIEHFNIVDKFRLNSILVFSLSEGRRVTESGAGEDQQDGMSRHDERRGELSVSGGSQLRTLYKPVSISQGQGQFLLH